MRSICLFVALVCLALGAQAQVARNGVNVVVNGVVITSDQVDGSILPMVPSIRSEFPNDPAGFNQKILQLRSEAIEGLIEDELILEEFKTAGYMLPESFIEDSIRDKIHKQYYGERSRLIKELQSEGLTYEMYRKREREHYIVAAMRDQNASLQKVLISPAKIETYYNDHRDEFKAGDQARLRMIFVPQPPSAAPGMAKKLAEEILGKIAAGVPFAEMAGVYGSGSTRVEGGDCGWVDRKYYKQELTQVIFSLKAGQHSGVVDLPEGCYLLQVDDVRPAHVRGLDEVRSEVEKTLRTGELQRLQKKWIARLKAKSFVRYY